MYDNNLCIVRIKNVKTELSDLQVDKPAGKDVWSVGRHSLHRQIQWITFKTFRMTVLALVVV